MRRSHFQRFILITMACSAMSAAPAVAVGHGLAHAHAAAHAAAHEPHHDEDVDEVHAAEIGAASHHDAHEHAVLDASVKPRVADLELAPALPARARTVLVTRAPARVYLERVDAAPSSPPLDTSRQPRAPPLG